MSVPLKAVYRDTTVGIRYLFPVDAANTSVYMRLFSPLHLVLWLILSRSSVDFRCPLSRNKIRTRSFLLFEVSALVK